MTGRAILNEVLTTSRKAVASFNRKQSSAVATIRDQAQRAGQAAHGVGAASTREWLSRTSSLYYRNFERAPQTIQPLTTFPVYLSEEWQERTVQDVEAHVERVGGTPALTELNKGIEVPLKAAKSLGARLYTELVLVREDPAFAEEAKLLEAIKSRSWGHSIDDFIAQVAPQRTVIPMYRASEQLITPPHIMVWAHAGSIMSTAQAILDFQADCDRLLRQLEIKIGAPSNAAASEHAYHALIEEVARDRVRDRHYADAVLAAMRAVNTRVRDHVRAKTGKSLDGVTLMQQAFSPNNPIIVLGDLTTTSGADIQKGYMDLFVGAMMGIRNPKAHEEIVITPRRANQFLTFASLLMDRLDEAGVPTRPVAGGAAATLPSPSGAQSRTGTA